MNSFKGFAVLLIAVISTTVLWDNAMAAEISKSDDSQCAIELSGDIEPGDAARFADLAMRMGLTELPDSGEPSNRLEDALCLDSNGGAYLEGRSIAAILREYGIPTRLLAGANCYSSCAFIFMAGRLVGGESETTKRTMHVKSHLGFHAPYFAFDDAVTMRGPQVNEIVSLSSKLIADFVQFGSGSSAFSAKPFFPISLIVELLGAGPNEMAMVDTVQDVSRWEIELDGHQTSASLDDAGRMRACINFQNWALDRSSEIGNLSWVHFPLERINLSKYGKDQQYAVADTGGMELRQCLVEVTQGPRSYIQICSRDEFNGLIFGDCQQGWGFQVEWYYGLDPQTKISELAK